ncbi:MAG: hypothetical protein JNL21_13095 [Myxococcales bacterium]|nr:hypothetical protein [Myxococcales bacterium]
MTIRMGYWDCPSCGNKKNLGPNPTCSGCGRPRGPNIPFYTDDSAPVVEDPALVAQARAGADWKCKYCNADNRAGVMDCHHCGAGPDGSVRRQEKYVALGPPPKKGVDAKIIIAIVLGVLGVLGFGIWFLFGRTTSLSVTVESAAWVKSVEVEQKELKRDAAWQDEVPANARVVGKETKGRSKKVQEGTKKVKVGRKDLGNGMFEDVYKEEPNYVTKQVDDTWVRYEVEVWEKKETLKEETTDGSEPKDPASRFKPGGDRRLGKSQNAAVFQLKGSDGKRYTFEVDVDKEGAGAVTKYQIGKSYTAKVNTLGAVLALGP